MRWGIVATIKAPVRDILNFAAHHLEIGADHLFIYLDDDNPQALAALDTHPQITVTRTDQRYWKADGKHRPAKHQVRQVRNATHAHQRATDLLDWLIHMDVDEFLWPARPIASQLADLPAPTQTARVHPIEAMAQPENAPETDETMFKGFIPANGKRQMVSEALFPNFGRYVKGGFLSHVQGKVFVRTGLEGIEIRIHNAFQDGVELSQKATLTETELCHLHVTNWDRWHAHYRYRHNRGSYRSELRAAVSPKNGGMTLHELFAYLEQTDGKAGLRAFFDEVCVATPALCEELSKRGLLRSYRLDLNAKRLRHFPQTAETVA